MPVCTECWDQPEFKNETALRQHSEAKHLKPRELDASLFYCTVPGCFRGFQKDAGRITHEKVVHKISQPNTPRSSTPTGSFFNSPKSTPKSPPSLASPEINILVPKDLPAPAEVRKRNLFAALVGNTRPRSRTIIGPVDSMKPTGLTASTGTPASTHSGQSVLESSPKPENAEKLELPRALDSPRHAVVDMQLEDANLLDITTKDSDLFSPHPRHIDVNNAVTTEAPALPVLEEFNDEPISVHNDEAIDIHDAEEKQFSPAESVPDTGGWQVQTTISTDTPSELQLSSPSSSSGSSEIENISQKVDSPHVETLLPLEELEPHGNQSSHCESSCCRSPPVITMLPEISPSTWQSIPSNRDAQSPVPFVEPEQEVGRLGIPSHKSPPGTPFFEAHTSLSPFLDDDRVLVIDSAQSHYDSKLDRYAEDDEDSGSDLSSEFGGTKSRFFCRICKADPCTELTTTTCGHLFCSECIAQMVVETSRCPVCNNTILLYCLFRIDLDC